MSIDLEEKKIEELSKNKKFLKYICNLETPEKIQLAFKEEGVNVSIDDLLKLRKFINLEVKNKGKLPDDMLNISGGSKKEFIKNNWGKLIGVGLGIIGVVGLGGALYLKASETMENATDKIDDLSFEVNNNIRQIVHEVKKTKNDISEKGAARVVHGPGKGNNWLWRLALDE